MWISQENEDSFRKEDRQSKTSHGAQKTDSLTYRFPKQARLLKKRDYYRVLRSKNRFTGDFLSIDFRHDPLCQSKLGITVSRRFGKAHDRNRFKRIVREIFRLNYILFPVNLEINVVPRNKAPLSFEEIIQDFHQFLYAVKS